MKYLTKMERVTIVVDIMKKLKNFKGKRGETIDLYNDMYSFVTEFKDITKQYIEQPDDNVKEFKGILFFDEIGKHIEYILPAKPHRQPLFVIRGSNL